MKRMMISIIATMAHTIGIQIGKSELSGSTNCSTLYSGWDGEECVCVCVGGGGGEHCKEYNICNTKQTDARGSNPGIPGGNLLAIM